VPLNLPSSEVPRAKNLLVHVYRLVMCSLHTISLKAPLTCALNLRKRAEIVAKDVEMNSQTKDSVFTGLKSINKFLKYTTQDGSTYCRIVCRSP
jgi:hypothetical protein